MKKIPDELVQELIKAAEQMPRATPEAGENCTLHTFEIEAGVVWSLDRALKKIETFKKIK